MPLSISQRSQVRPGLRTPGLKRSGCGSSSSRIRPLLVENATLAIGAKKQKGILRLDSREAMLKGGESGPAIVPGKPGESLLVEAVNYDGSEMPPSASSSRTSSRS